MKVILIIIFIFLLICNSAMATTETHIWEKDISDTNDYQTGAGTAGYQARFATIYSNDISEIEGLYFASISVDISKISAGAFPLDSDYSNVQFKIGSTIIGSGIAGYSRSSTKIFVNYWVQSDGGLNIFGYSSSQTITVAGAPFVYGDKVEYGYQSGAPAYPFMPCTHSAPWYYYPATADIDYRTYRYFYNKIVINDINNIIEVNITRSVGNTSKFVITDPSVLVNETSLQSDNILTATINNSINIYGINYADNIFDYTYFGTIDSDGRIELNQSSYTEPEDIQIDVELTIYNFDFNSYYIITETSEDLDTWDNVAGTYNGTTKITNTTDTRVLDVDTWLYDLPIWIRSRLVEYNKRTGEYTTVDTSTTVLYHPPTPDSIKFGGTVIDADTNQIIAGATVSVEGVTTTSDTTNAFGEFLMYIYPGIYTVTTSKTGYQTYTSEELLMEVDNTWAQIYLTPIGYGNGTLYGNVNDVDTGYAIQDVHVIITNATDQIDAYTSSGGYYEATGLAQSSTYTIKAVKSGYYTYNGSVTTGASGATHKSFNMVPETPTPTPTATVLPTSTYPGGEGHEWTNDEIVTMLRVLVPGFFLLMLVFLLLAVMLGISGNNGNSGQGRSGLSEIWRR